MTRDGLLNAPGDSLSNALVGYSTGAHHHCDLRCVFVFQLAGTAMFCLQCRDTWASAGNLHPEPILLQHYHSRHEHARYFGRSRPKPQAVWRFFLLHTKFYGDLSHYQHYSKYGCAKPRQVDSRGFPADIFHQNAL